MSYLSCHVVNAIRVETIHVCLFFIVHYIIIVLLHCLLIMFITSIEQILWQHISYTTLYIIGILLFSKISECVNVDVVTRSGCVCMERMWGSERRRLSRDESELWGARPIDELVCGWQLASWGHMEWEERCFGGCCLGLARGGFYWMQDNSSLLWKSEREMTRYETDIAGKI